MFEHAIRFNADYLAEPVFDTAVADGFSYRTVVGDFIFTTELRHPGGAGGFGLQVEFNGQVFRTEVSAEVFQVERKGDQPVLCAARFGAPLAVIDGLPAPAGQPIKVGVFKSAEVEMRNARWTIPAGPSLVPYTDYLGSRLELLDMASGAREVIFPTEAGIEAPNWTPDGHFITFNSGGRIYRLELATKLVTEIDTGEATRNNNDHVISWDGQWLGISHHSAAHGGESIVYKLPIEGGEALALTHQGPSYLHGWSPDGRHVIYTARRNGVFNIYRTSTDGAGIETQLTDGPGLDDGSEYAPDGQHIYFNSSRTGVMQLWRMRPDGSAQQQLTQDAFNNWFPHVSPNGRELVFLSYQPSMQADKHPYYQHVYLRAMPAEGGTPRVVAYLYGGQGTINVPSWSPDGKWVAFVSHTGQP